MLEIGAKGKLQTRCHSFAAQAKATLLYISDLHFSERTPHLSKPVLEIVEQVQPDVVLLGGDMVDSQSGLHQLTNCIQQMQNYCPVWAISGNHEDYVGVELVRDCVEAAGGLWLDGSSQMLGDVRVDGSCQPQNDQSLFSVLCAHDPAVFPQAVVAGYDLVLAGHLHGSQCVFFSYRGRMYPGAWFFRWNGDSFQAGKSTLIVSRGVNDTLPIRWNCPREVIVCKIG